MERLTDSNCLNLITPVQRTVRSLAAGEVFTAADNDVVTALLPIAMGNITIRLVNDAIGSSITIPVNANQVYPFRVAQVFASSAVGVILFGPFIRDANDANGVTIDRKNQGLQ